MAVNDEWEKLNLEYCKKRRERNNADDDEIVHIDLPLTIKHQIELLKNSGFDDVEVLGKPFETDSNVVFIKARKK